MLFRRYAGHGLEPVGIMGRALFQGPILHGVGHHARNGRVQRAAFLHGALQRLIGFLWQALLHHGIVKYGLAKSIQWIAHASNPLFL